MDCHELLLTVFSIFYMLTPKLHILVNLTACSLTPFEPFKLMRYFPSFTAFVLMCHSLFCTDRKRSNLMRKMEPKRPLKVRNLHLLFIIFVMPWPAFVALAGSMF